MSPKSASSNKMQKATKTLKHTHVLLTAYKNTAHGSDFYRHLRQWFVGYDEVRMNGIGRVVGKAENILIIPLKIEDTRSLAAVQRGVSSVAGYRYHALSECLTPLGEEPHQLYRLAIGADELKKIGGIMQEGAIVRNIPTPAGKPSGNRACVAVITPVRMCLALDDFLEDGRYESCDIEWDELPQ